MTALSLVPGRPTVSEVRPSGKYAFYYLTFKRLTVTVVSPSVTYGHMSRGGDGLPSFRARTLSRLLSPNHAPADLALGDTDPVCAIRVPSWRGDLSTRATGGILRGIVLSWEYDLSRRTESQSSYGWSSATYRALLTLLNLLQQNGTSVRWGD